jgi:flagellar protein FlgJ
MQLDSPTLAGHVGGAEPDPNAKVHKAAEQFEAHFIKQLMAHMREATCALADDDSPLKSKFNEGMFDVTDGLVADSLASQRAFGIADMLIKQLQPQLDLSSVPDGSPYPGKDARGSSGPFDATP